MTDHCANPKCKKELVHTEGRRKKKYCAGHKCRVAHWQMLHPAYKPKTVRVPIDELEKLKAQIAENNLPENKERILKERNTAHIPKTQNPLTPNESEPPSTENTEADGSGIEEGKIKRRNGS